MEAPDPRNGKTQPVLSEGTAGSRRRLDRRACECQDSRARVSGRGPRAAVRRDAGIGTSRPGRNSCQATGEFVMESSVHYNKLAICPDLPLYLPLYLPRS